METKIQREQSPRIGSSDAYNPGPWLSQMKRSHWIIFFVICLVLGILVFATAVHIIDTTPSKAKLIHAPSPVETTTAKRQNLDEVIGGAGSVEQGETAQLTSQVTAEVLEVPVKIGDIVKKRALLIRMDDRLIQATLEANRAYVESNKIKIKDESNQVARYKALEQKNMGTASELEKSEMALADAKEALAKATLSLRQAEIDLEHVKINSPFDAIVLERLVNPGENAHREQIVLKLGSLNNVL